MALNYKILYSKPVMSRLTADGNTEEYYDLLASNFTKNDTFISKVLWIVNKYYVGRPDLVSLAFYGTDEYADIICKINGISNPFELAEDDILIIPEVGELYNIAHTTCVSETIDDNTSIGSNEKNYQKLKTAKRTANEQIIGDSNYVIDHSRGLIYY